MRCVDKDKELLKSIKETGIIPVGLAVSFNTGDVKIPRMIGYVKRYIKKDNCYIIVDYKGKELPYHPHFEDIEPRILTEHKRYKASNSVNIQDFDI